MYVLVFEMWKCKKNKCRIRSHIYGCDYKRSMIWWLDLLTLLGTTSNYSALADLHTLEMTAANTKSSPARSVFNSRSLATAPICGDSAASCTQDLVTAVHAEGLSIPSCQLPTINSRTRLTLLIKFQYEPHREQHFHCYTQKIPWLLHAYSLLGEPIYRALAER